MASMTRTLSRRRRIVAVLIGGFLGTVARYSLSMLVQGWLGKAWPYDILLINVTGAFLLALITTLADETFLVGPTRRLFLNVGFMGAYTTFSSFALGEALLVQKAQLLPALLYLLLTISCGILAILLGDLLGQQLVSRSSRRREVALTRPREAAAYPEPHSSVSGERLRLDVRDDLFVQDRQEGHETRHTRGF